MVSNENSAYIEEDSENQESDHLRKTEEKSRNGAISCKHSLWLVNKSLIFI
jgi:hypothetical protein